MSNLMNYTKILPLILFSISVYLILLGLHTAGLINSIIFSPIFILIFVPTVILVSFIIINLRISKTIKKIIDVETVKSHIYEVETTKGKYYFIGFKIKSKKVPPDAQVDFISEIYDAIDSVYRNKSRKSKAVVITLLDPEPGSAIILYSKAENWNEFVNEALNLKYAVEGPAPHITLEPTSLKMNPVVPIPEIIEVYED